MRSSEEVTSSASLKYLGKSKTNLGFLKWVIEVTLIQKGLPFSDTIKNIYQIVFPKIFFILIFVRIPLEKA